MDKKNREILAIAFACRRFLNLHGFISYSDNEKIHQRVLKRQDKLKINLSDKQINSVEFLYKD